MAEADEELRKTLLELRMMEGSADLIQSRLNIVNAALGETILAANALEGVKGCPKGTEVLVPVGAGSYLRMTLTDVENAITGVGAGVCIEKSIESSIQDLKSRQEELEKLSSSLQQQLIQLLNNIESSKVRLSRLIEAQSRSQPQKA
ncbi:prefoldin subunit alpha [Candidatus Bathyarchaeota archaeon]|nr:prefoldin subunit alpha [Candidatus Bathyarchaeota archaeon]